MKKMNALTIAEVAELFKVNRHTLYQLIYAGEIKAFRCGKSFRITENALEEFIASNSVA